MGRDADGSTRRVFLLSPASCTGERARLLTSPRAAFDLARRLRGPEGAALGDLFSFLSGLYFRGKLAYARAFAAPPDAADPVVGGGVFVITPTAGLQPPEVAWTLTNLRAAACTDIRLENRRYRRPLETSALTLAARLGTACEVVLLGSVATDKYVGVLGSIFTGRLVFPAEFVGRGDMSRGGLLLRCVREARELTYVPVAGAVRHGPRPPKLERIPGILGQADRGRRPGASMQP